MLKRSIAILTTLIAGTVVFLGGCSKQPAASAAAPGSAGGRPPAPVVVSESLQRDIPIQITAIGNIEAIKSVQIRSQVNGQIESVDFREGQDVHKGQLLFTLDKRPFQATLNQAEAQLKRDQATAENAQQEATRYSSLEQQGVISREMADQQRTAARSNSSAVVADQAAVEAARVQLLYTDIKAPIDGRAGAIMINLGNLVKANDTPYLVQINQIKPIYATFSIPEKYLSEVRNYMGRNLKVMAYPKGQRSNGVAGTLTFIDNGVDPTTGTVKLKATYPNQDSRLWPGEYVDIILDLSTQKGAILVPTKAVQEGQQGTYIYVVKADNTAEARPVEVTGTYQDLSVIARGVQPGEKVVVEGQVRIAPGGKVVVQSTAPASAASSQTAAAGPPGGGQ